MLLTQEERAHSEEESLKEDKEESKEVKRLTETFRSTVISSVNRMRLKYPQTWGKEALTSHQEEMCMKNIRQEILRFMYYYNAAPKEPPQKSTSSGRDRGGYYHDHPSPRSHPGIGGYGGWITNEI